MSFVWDDPDATLVGHLAQGGTRALPERTLLTMTDPEAPRFYVTTAIDYPNSRPHIGTAFEKIGADVQARFRRMEGRDVHFQMGNDENTIKVSQAAAKLNLEPKP
ncbi:MAG: class I tRNA ligase family protein, partial [Isosphaeraceae bacterium]